MAIDAFNDLVDAYQDALFALVARMVPDRDQALRRRPGGLLLGVPQPSLVSRRERPLLAVPDRGNGAMDTPARGKAAARPTVPGALRTRLATTGRPGGRSRANGPAHGAHAGPAPPRFSDHRRSAGGDRAVRRRGLRLRRDRADDRRLARDGEVPDPPRPTRASGCSTIAWSSFVDDRHDRRSRRSSPTPTASWSASSWRSPGPRSRIAANVPSSWRICGRSRSLTGTGDAVPIARFPVVVGRRRTARGASGRNRSPPQAVSTLDMTGTPTPHASHDPELIAAAVGGDLEADPATPGGCVARGLCAMRRAPRRSARDRTARTGQGRPVRPGRATSA